MNARSVVDSLNELEARVALVPHSLRTAANVPLPELGSRSTTRIVATGVGASEGPARVLASLLVTGGGPPAFFAPISAFACERPRADVLVVFSQGLSPNARLALDAHVHYARTILVTSVAFEHPSRSEGSLETRAYVASLEASGVDVIRVPPAREDGTLVRIVGPTVAVLLAIRLAARFGAVALESLDPHEAADAYLEAPTAPTLPDDRVHLVAAGIAPELLTGHRSKLLEGFFLPPPAIFDVLDVAHGPFQVLFERGCTFLVLGTPRGRGLLERFRTMLRETPHALLTVDAKRDDPLAYFEHAGALDRQLLHALRARPRDLYDWPGRGIDKPLYDLGR